MKYLTAVVKECLRIDPPVEFGLRMVTESFQLGPYQVQPGQALFVHYPTVHKNAFAQSETFDPDRWYKQSPKFNADYAHDIRNAFCTFAGGGRLCPGWKVSVGAVYVALLTGRNTVC